MAFPAIDLVPSMTSHTKAAARIHRPRKRNRNRIMPWFRRPRCASIALPGTSPAKGRAARPPAGDLRGITPPGAAVQQGSRREPGEGARRPVAALRVSVLPVRRQASYIIEAAPGPQRDIVPPATAAIV